MKNRNPKHRLDLKINKRDKVVDIGSGDNPHQRANLLVDKYIDSNYHRRNNIKILKHQLFKNADGENLPFKDKEFDYVICCQVLEHVNDPVKFLNELFRIGKRGYIETPSLIGEYLSPKESHKWILHEHENCLYIINKEKIGFNVQYDLGELFQSCLPKHSIGFKIMERTHPNMLTIRIEWEDDFNYIVDPMDPNIRKYFSNKWDENWQNNFFPYRNIFKEFVESFKAFCDIVSNIIKSRILKHLRKND